MAATGDSARSQLGTSGTELRNEGLRDMKTITRRVFVGGVAVLPVLRLTAADAQISASPAEARAIAKEAYVYGFPIVDNYRIQHAYWVDRATPE
jgi:hypothetical protein